MSLHSGEYNRAPSWCCIRAPQHTVVLCVPWRMLPPKQEEVDEAPGRGGGEHHSFRWEELLLCTNCSVHRRVRRVRSRKSRCALRTRFDGACQEGQSVPSGWDHARRSSTHLRHVPTRTRSNRIWMGLVARLCCCEIPQRPFPGDTSHSREITRDVGVRGVLCT